MPSSKLKFLVLFVAALMVEAFSGASVARAVSPEIVRKFDFGPGASAAGYTQVLPTTAYNQTLKYGFTDITRVTSRDRGAPDSLRGDFCMPVGTDFKVDLPNGDYNVTVISGDQIAFSTVSIAAEGIVRLNPLGGVAGQFGQGTFQVTVADGQLNLTFTGSAPRVNAVEISSVLRFDCGPGPTAPGYVQILQSTAYNTTRSFGWQDVTKVSSRDRGGADPLLRDFCLPLGTPFNVDLPNGDYTVTVASGDATAASTMNVLAEGLARLTPLAASTGQFTTGAFNISVIDGQLNLDFSGTVCHVNGITITRLPGRVQGDHPTVYIAGDSTVMTYRASLNLFPQQGWGARIPEHFTSDVIFTNRAIGGRSSRTFVTDGRLDLALSQIRPNDYLFIQFGHNDASSDPTRHTDAFTTYKQFLSMYIDGARQRNAIPVLITPMGRRHFDAVGQFINDFPNYCTAMNQLAVEKNVELIDLNTTSINFYESIGVEATRGVFLWLNPGLFPNFPSGIQDSTHFQENGANEIARLVAQGVRETGLPIGAFVR
jgi:fibronectin type 3 domain-containing protein/lysophospholipase L1-like esterase